MVLRYLNQIFATFSVRTETLPCSKIHIQLYTFLVQGSNHVLKVVLYFCSFWLATKNEIFDKTCLRKAPQTIIKILWFLHLDNSHYFLLNHANSDWSHQARPNWSAFHRKKRLDPTGKGSIHALHALTLIYAFCGSMLKKAIFAFWYR